MKNIFSILLITFFAPSSFGVSRIGGGKILSTDSLFEILIATPFSDLEDYRETVIAKGPAGFISNQLISQFIQVREYKSSFLRLASLSRKETRDFFIAQSWDLYQEPNHCTEAFTYTNDAATGIALTWGGGKGVILEGPATSEVRQAIEQAVQTLTLLPGACSWK